MREQVTLNSKEQKRAMVLTTVIEGGVTVQQAREVLGLSVRHVRRLKAAYMREGPAALAHGNRGRRPTHALEDALRRRVVELAQTIYGGCNHQHLTELLAEREGIHLSRSSVRRILPDRSGGCAARAGGVRPSTAPGGSGCPGPACSCRSTVVATAGWKSVAPG